MGCSTTLRPRRLHGGSGTGAAVCTVFAIAHRLSTLHRASRLFVIKHGRLAESGTHEELRNSPVGIYARLHGLQMQLRAGV